MFRFPQISPPYGAIMHENEIAPTAAPKEIPWNKGMGNNVSIYGSYACYGSEKGARAA